MTLPAPLALALNQLAAKFPGNLGAGSGGLTSSITTPTGQIVTIVDGVITNVFGESVGAAGPVNSAYFTNLIASVNAIQTCSLLQDKVDDVWAQLQSQLTDVNAQLALLLPILALLTAPTNPTAVITWIENFITAFLTPYVAPYANYAIQLTELATQITSLTTAVENAADRIGGPCHITIPPLTGL